MMLKKLLQPIKIYGITVHWSVLLLIVAGVRLVFLHRLLIAYAITAVHECAHILVARRLGVKVSGVEIMPFGITMRLGERGFSHTSDEIKVAIAGPVSNFIIAYGAYCMVRGEARAYVICTSLVIGLFNLLPALPLDGGRILKAVLVSRFGCIRGTGTAMRVTRLFALVMALFGMYVLYITKFNFSVLIVGAFLIANITEEKRSTNMVIMKDILYSRRKLEEKGAEQGGVLVVQDFEKAKNVLNRLTYDKYYLISIVDGSMRVAYTLTETSFIEGLAAYGMNVKMRKFVGI